MAVKTVKIRTESAESELDVELDIRVSSKLSVLHSVESVLTYDHDNDDKY